MNLVLRSTVVFALTIATSLFAVEIHETKQMSDVMKHVDTDTLLIFDLDNTIVMPAQTLGGEEWYDFLFDKYLAENKALKMTAEQARLNAIARALTQWNAVQSVTKAVPAEEKGPELIVQAQERGTKTLALTARPVELISATDAQLKSKSVGIDFTKGLYYPQNFDIKQEGVSRYQDGLIYVGAINKKGPVLVEFLRRAGTKPKKIVFVDNKLHHVEDVGKFVEKLGIPYVGCRHGATDAKIEAFQKGTELKKIAEIQHQDFQRILSDKEAAALLPK